MSKRVTLTDFEIQQIINGLTELRNQPILKYEVVRVGQRWYDRLIRKLEPKIEPPTPTKVEDKGESNG